MNKHILLFFAIIFSVHSFSQDCKMMLSDVNVAIKQAEDNIENKLSSSVKPDYAETFIIYPVISRYYNKTKNRDTLYIRKFEDFGRTVWCFRGVCFNNNKSFFLSKKEILEKIKDNDLSNSYQRETICMLCDKYQLDTTSIIKLLNYNNDTVNASENKNAIDYGFLHKALLLSDLKANKCINQSIFDRYQLQLTDSIYKIFIYSVLNPLDGNENISSRDNDLYFEALLMMSILDEKINISDSLYERIIGSQLKDGSWGETNVNGHTTIVSFWLLLDLQKKLKLYTH